jgi:hypothetical protein
VSLSEKGYEKVQAGLVTNEFLGDLIKLPNILGRWTYLYVFPALASASRAYSRFLLALCSMEHPALQSPGVLPGTDTTCASMSLLSASRWSSAHALWVLSPTCVLPVSCLLTLSWS